ncbi:hypothetical protein D3C85_1686840 [compost metagenome]
MCFASASAGQQQGTSTVIHTTGIACCHGTIGTHDRLERGQRLKGCGARMLVKFDH